MKTKQLFPFIVWFAIACCMGAVVLAQALPDDWALMPEGVTIQAFGGGGFRVLSIASAPCRSDAPAALSVARTVATAKAKAALARFLDETVSVEEFLERESVRVRRTNGGTDTVDKTDVRRTLVRIKAESLALLRGVKELGTDFSPTADGGGVLRLAVGVDSSTISDAEALEDAMLTPAFGN